MSPYKLSTLFILSAAILVSSAMFTSTAWLWILAPLGMLAWLDLCELRRSEKKAGTASAASFWGFYVAVLIITMGFHFFGRTAFISEFPAVRTAPRSEFRPPLNASPKAAASPNPKAASGLEMPKLPPGSSPAPRHLNSTVPPTPASASQRPVTPAAAAAPTASRTPASSTPPPPQTNTPAAPPAPIPPQ